ncbi:hypothetical protein [uncultured Draconibacterium sp.]|uniref:hypothetical protein n=1 Tax=uncultured Draconibacterium sp. TaxID=1573823 RepID=UPI0025F87D79|nr:hypothetical protein [uncultured Draconibacterium sp.]
MKVKRLAKLESEEVDTARSRLIEAKDYFIEKFLSADFSAETAEEFMHHLKSIYVADSLCQSLYRHLTGEQNYDYEE